MYLDTAILVKLFVRERDSDFYGHMTEGRSIVSSSIAFTETWAALLAKERNGETSQKERVGAWKRFSQQVEEESIILIPLSEALLKKANRIIFDVHPGIPLRSLDALHLASCDQAQEWPLCTNDKRMRLAAERLKFPLADLPS